MRAHDGRLDMRSATCVCNAVVFGTLVACVLARVRFGNSTLTLLEAALAVDTLLAPPTLVEVVLFPTVPSVRALAARTSWAEAIPESKDPCISLAAASLSCAVLRALTEISAEALRVGPAAAPPAPIIATSRSAPIAYKFLAFFPVCDTTAIADTLELVLIIAAAAAVAEAPMTWGRSSSFSFLLPDIVVIIGFKFGSRRSAGARSVMAAVYITKWAVFFHARIFPGVPLVRLFDFFFACFFLELESVSFSS